MERGSFAIGALGAVVALSALSVSAQGQGRQGGQMCCGNMDTPGWSLMSPEERTEHRNKVLSLTNYDECMVYVEEHHAKMGERADQKGVTLRQPRHNLCDRLQGRGRLN